MRMIIEMDMNNAAFTEDGPGAASYEAARILRRLAEQIAGHTHFTPGHDQALHDINGNEVGRTGIYGDRS